MSHSEVGYLSVLLESEEDMAGLPPAAKPPGRPLYGESKREVEAVYRVRGVVSQGALAAQQRPPRKPRAVSHLGVFRDGYGVNREPNGRFTKESGVPHKRPPKLPPFVGPWTEERKAKARHTRATRRREP